MTRRKNRPVQDIARPQPPAVPRPSLPAWLAVVLIPALTFLFYFNSLAGEFVWDDKLLVEGNPTITSFSRIKEAFTQDLFRKTDKATGYYRPVQTVTYMADHRLWGKNPFGYHLTSVALQSANALLVFWLLFMLFGDALKSFLAAAVFAVHPAFVPVAAYISGRADLLGFFFGMMTVIAAVRYLRTGKGKMWLIPGVVSYVLAFLSKEYYLAMPLFVLAYAYAFKGERKLDRAALAFLAGLALAAGAYILLRATVLNFHQDMGTIARSGLFTRLALVPYNLTRYIGTLILPFDLSMEKKLFYASAFEPRFVACYLTVAVLAVAWVRWQRRRKLEFFFLLWFLAGLLPVIHLLFPLKTVFADHWVYPASVGFFALGSGLIGTLLKKWTPAGLTDKLFLAVAALLVIFYGGRTVAENRHWRNEETFYAHTSEANPSSSRPVYNMGKLLEERGENEKALEQFDRAVAMKPEDASYRWSRGHLYRKMGDKKRALEDLMAAVRLAPENSRYRSDLGAIYAELGRTGEAVDSFKKALEIDPNDVLAGKNLAILTGEKELEP